MSKLNDMWDALVTGVTGLDLTLGDVVLPVVKRKVPRHEETIDPNIQICICGFEAIDEVTRLNYVDLDVIYYFHIVIVSPNNDDMLLYLPEYTDWREAIRNLYRGPLIVGAPTVWNVEILRGSFLNRAEISKQYDYQEVNLKIHSAEPAR